ncbi:MAG TPA: proton-conducting transporter membrane subunit [Candidatus Sulfotelmatobacter sp.]|nr:proton-conducting transporter membrane subunit [Candidatus Sulfotelmatobacter sp.]
MRLGALVLVPILGAVAAYFDAPARRSRWLVGAALLHLAMVAWAWGSPPATSAIGWLRFEPLGGLVLTLVSVVFVAVAFYAVGYLRREDPRGGRAFVSALLAFLASASMVSLTHHFGLLWVGMEATTLTTAPLIYDPRDRHSLDAVWKYLLVCSVGIAIALLGTFFLATAQLAATRGGGAALVLEDLVAEAPRFHPVWLRAAFVLLLVGFGTKMGLAPMHTWLPDAHGEAPSPISALLSGALLNLAFLAILRALQVVNASAHPEFARTLLIGFGLLSVAVAAVFLLGQLKYKRMLAYSSVEQVGILALGAGLSGTAAWGALFLMWCGSLAKAALFMSTGSIFIRYGSKRTAEVSGVGRVLPLTAVLLAVGLFAVSGSPPFGTFLGEIALLSGAIRTGRLGVAVAVLALQAAIFASMAAAIFGMVLGRPAAEVVSERGPEDRWLTLPPLVLLAGAALLGSYLPPALRGAFDAAARAIGGAAP